MTERELALLIARRVIAAPGWASDDRLIAAVLDTLKDADVRLTLPYVLNDDDHPRSGYVGDSGHGDHASAARAVPPSSRNEETSVLQAVLDAIKGTLDPSTQIADHPNVKFAQMERLKWEQQNAELLTAARFVFSTFVRDEAQGYHSRDRQFAIAVLGAALPPRVVLEDGADHETDKRVASTSGSPERS